MNPLQRTIAAIGLLAIAALCAFPPWQTTAWQPGTPRAEAWPTPLFHYPVWGDPTRADMERYNPGFYSRFNRAYTIDVTRLAIEVAAVGFSTAALAAMTSIRWRPSSQKHP